MNQISFIVTGQTGNHELLCVNADVTASNDTRRNIAQEGGSKLLDKMRKIKDISVDIAHNNGDSNQVSSVQKYQAYTLNS